MFVVFFSPLCQVRLRENRENLAWDAFDKSLFKARERQAGVQTARQAFNKSSLYTKYEF